MLFFWSKHMINFLIAHMNSELHPSMCWTIKSFIIINFVRASIPQSETLQRPLTFREQELNFSWRQCFHFTRYTFAEKYSFPNEFFYFRKPFAKATCSFSFCCAPSLFSFYFSHSLLKKTDLYLKVCILVNVSRRFPPKRKFSFLLLCFNVQHTVGDSAVLQCEK